MWVLRIAGGIVNLTDATTGALKVKVNVIMGISLKIVKSPKLAIYCGSSVLATIFGLKLSFLAAPRDVGFAGA